MDPFANVGVLNVVILLKIFKYDDGSILNVIGTEQDSRSVVHIMYWHVKFKKKKTF